MIPVEGRTRVKIPVEARSGFEVPVEARSKVKIPLQLIACHVRGQAYNSSQRYTQYVRGILYVMYTQYVRGILSMLEVYSVCQRYTHYVSGILSMNQVKFQRYEQSEVIHGGPPSGPDDSLQCTATRVDFC